MLNWHITDALPDAAIFPGPGLHLGRSQCANPQCPRSWTTVLRDRRRPIFERRWACSSRCLKALVGLAIHRARRETVDLEAEPNRHRFPLGLILLTKGWITNPQLQRALDRQRMAEPHLLGQLLIEEYGVSPQHIARALGMQWGCPVLNMEGLNPESMALALPEFLIDALGTVPLRIARDRVLYLGRAGRPDASAALAIERMSGLRVVSGVIDRADQERAQQSIASCAAVDASVEHAADFESMSRRIATVIAAAEPRASCLVNIHGFYWLRMWWEAGSMSTPAGGFPRTREDVTDHIYILGHEQ